MMHPARAIAALSLFVMPIPAWATQPKLDADTCTALRLEQIKFRQSGILDDMSKGPEWAKANLSADRLREVEHYLALDEQVKFGCRDAKLSPEAEKASEAAARIEINSDADPTAPLDPTKPKAKKAADQPNVKRRTTHKKAKAADPKAENIEPAKANESKVSESAGKPAAAAAVAAPDEGATGGEVPTLPAFGFGEMTVVPHMPASD